MKHPKKIYFMNLFDKRDIFNIETLSNADILVFEYKNIIPDN